MPRIVEIVLFLTPFIGFAVWRMLSPAPAPPAWLLGGLVTLVVLAVLALLWGWYLDAGDGRTPYIPAQIHDGGIVPAGAAVPR